MRRRLHSEHAQSTEASLDRVSAKAWQRGGVDELQPDLLCPAATIVLIAVYGGLAIANSEQNEEIAHH